MHLTFDGGFLAALPTVFMFTLTFFLSYALYQTRRADAPASSSSKKR